MQRTNEEQLDLFADLLEPVAEILADIEIAEIMQNGCKLATAVKLTIKRHKTAVIALLAALDGETPEAYHVPGPVGLAKKLMQLVNNLVNNPELQEFFTSQGQTTDAASSGSATENTGGGAH